MPADGDESRKDGGLDDMNDDQILQTLGEALAVDDAVPAEVLVAAQASFTWRTIDADLAALTYDSLLDDDRLATVRGAISTGPRALTFEFGDVVVDIEVADTGSSRQLLGQVVADGVEAVVVEQPGAPAGTVLAVDDLGRFRATGIGPGPIRLRCRLAGADRPDFVTDWVVI
jgi:hypothetical protein